MINVSEQTTKCQHTIMFYLSELKVPIWNPSKKLLPHVVNQTSWQSPLMKQPILEKLIFRNSINLKVKKYFILKTEY